MKKHLIFLITIFMGVSAHAFQGEQAIYPVDEWTVRIAPVFGPQTFDGVATLANDSRSFDMNISDLSDKVTISVLGQFEFWKGRFGILSELGYVDMWAAKTDANNHVEFNGDLFTMDVCGSYGLGPWTTKNTATALELIAGVRLSYVDASLKIDPGSSHSANKLWGEPLIGSRLGYNFLELWRAEVRGDIGGFSIGSASQKTARFLAALHCQIDPSIDLFGGYRIYDFKTEDVGDGASLELNGRISGPVVGITFIFAGSDSY